MSWVGGIARVGREDPHHSPLPLAPTFEDWPGIIDHHVRPGGLVHAPQGGAGAASATCAPGGVLCEDDASVHDPGGRAFAPGSAGDYATQWLAMAAAPGDADGAAAPTTLLATGHDADAEIHFECQWHTGAHALASRPCRSAADASCNGDVFALLQMAVQSGASLTPGSGPRSAVSGGDSANALWTPPVANGPAEQEPGAVELRAGARVAERATARGTNPRNAHNGSRASSVERR